MAIFHTFCPKCAFLMFGWVGWCCCPPPPQGVWEDTPPMLPFSPSPGQPGGRPSTPGGGCPPRTGWNARAVAPNTAPPPFFVASLPVFSKPNEAIPPWGSPASLLFSSPGPPSHRAVYKGQIVFFCFRIAPYGPPSSLSDGQGPDWCFNGVKINQSKAHFLTFWVFSFFSRFLCLSPGRARGPIGEQVSCACRTRLPVSFVDIAVDNPHQTRLPAKKKCPDLKLRTQTLQHRKTTF